MSKKIAKLPAASFLSNQIANTRAALYESWLSELPAGTFQQFLEKGIEPLLQKFGYSLGFTRQDQIRMLRGWAFGHVQIQRQSKHYNDTVTILRCAHCGGEEEYDWFLNTIPLDAWYKIADTWFATDFLDDSDPGMAQRVDLPRLVWHMISLESSKAHHLWLNVLQDTMDQEDTIYDDSNIAFTGNRRTFS